MNREPRVGDLESEGALRPRPPWLLAAAVGLGGFALGLLVATTGGSSGPSESSPTLPPVPDVTTSTALNPNLTTLTPSTAVPATEPEVVDNTRLTLEELVPTFEGTLYFSSASFSSFQSSGLMKWPSNLSVPVTSTIPDGGWLELDASGGRMAFVGARGFIGARPDIAMTPLTLLSGLESSSPDAENESILVALGVTGFAWHATEPGLLAWVEQEGLDRWTLKVADFTHPETGFLPDVIADFDELVWPQYWSDQMYVLAAVDSDPDIVDDRPVFDPPRLWTLEPDGTLIAEAELEFVGATADGRLVVNELAGDLVADRISFLTDVSLSDRDRPGWLEGGGRLTHVTPSPDGEKTLVYLSNAAPSPGERFGVVILDEDEVTQCLTPAQADFIHWGPDSRWLVMQSAGRTEDGLWFTHVPSCEGFSVPFSASSGFLAAVGR